MIEEDGARGAGDGGVDVGIIENHVRRFAAEFERDFLQIARRSLHDQLADFGRTGERDFIDVADARRAQRRRFRHSPARCSRRRRESRLPE